MNDYDISRRDTFLFRPGISILVTATIALLVGVAWLVRLHQSVDNESVAAWLENRGKVAVVNGHDLFRFDPPGTRLVPIEKIPSLARTLDNRSLSELFDSMSHTGVQGFLVQYNAKSIHPGVATIRERLAASEYLRGLKAVFLSRMASLYIRNPQEELSPLSKQAVAAVARGVLGGARPPRIASFPESLRRLREAEVMVLLLQEKRERLWRSAKGNSIARALITAASIARKRWAERESVMGDRLDELLPKLDIDVLLLEEDGTILDRDRSFIDRVFTDQHVVAYQWKGSWRYRLPDMRSKAERVSAIEAYQDLFVRNNLPIDSWRQKDLRLYRLVISLLARSPTVR
ncbi:MAG: hypothetical protein JXA30_07530 [Deltaproteobacteria bacterium]|nr:hypothetical protein [Deltaproteobacteria bacterium]